MAKLKPVVFVQGKYAYNAQNTTQQLMLLKALKITQDPKKLKELIGVKTVAEVYRTLDKIAMRKEYHSALAKHGLTFDYIVEHVKSEIDGADKASDRLAGLNMILKSIGLDKYEESANTSGGWEDALLKISGEAKEKGENIRVAEYEVTPPEMPEHIRLAKKRRIKKQKDFMSNLIEQLADPKYYLEHFCKIKGKEGKGLEPFILKPAQLDIFNTIQKHNRIIIMKARQIGFSTAVTGFFYHKTITTPGVTSALVGYNNDLTAELLDKIKTFFNTTPSEIRPTIHYNSKFEISFPKWDSKILVLPSTENVGRGYTINYALLTEVPFWDKAEEKLVTLEASVPITGKIVIESSPGAVGDYFHRMWVSENDYIKKEYGWWWNYTEAEVEIIRRRMNNPRQFNNNYALEFLVSGRSVFTSETIAAQRRNVLKVGDKVKLEDGTEHVVREEEGFRIYKPPTRGHFYVLGADCSEGVTGGDYAVATILDRANGEEVGMWRGHIAPDKFAKVLNKWGRHYNNALMVVEAEAHGNVVLNVLKQMLYPSLYFRPSRFDTIGNPWSDKLGWKTTKVTRPILIDEFEQMTREENIIIHSKETVDEMTVFVFNDANNMVAMDSYHDDCIFATAIACQGFKVISDKKMDQLNYANHLPSLGY